MMQFDKKYPDFYFSNHKGYGTKLHKAAIKKHGITPIHRKTFKGVIA
jgi:ribonuclease HII